MQRTLQVLHHSLAMHTLTSCREEGAITSSLFCSVLQGHSRAESSDFRWRMILSCRVYASLRGCCVTNRSMVTDSQAILKQHLSNRCCERDHPSLTHHLRTHTHAHTRTLLINTPSSTTQCSADTRYTLGPTGPLLSSRPPSLVTQVSVVV
jgi:hypothetical protein